LSLPGQHNYEYGYGLAYELACQQLAELRDIEQQCLRSGAQYQVIDSQKIITLEYLNRSYAITLPEIELSLTDSDESIPLRERILILHYFIQAEGTALANKEIAYKELPEGIIYYPTFSKRAIKPLLDYFGKAPHRLIDIARKMGGREVDYGDAAVTIDAFSNVPITLVLWQGDDEFGPEGSILFDKSISDYLSIEDINVLCETITWKLVRYLKSS